MDPILEKILSPGRVTKRDSVRFLSSVQARVKAIEADYAIYVRETLRDGKTPLDIEAWIDAQ